jgi:hypothetical protein
MVCDRYVVVATPDWVEITFDVAPGDAAWSREAYIPPSSSVRTTTAETGSKVALFIFTMCIF